MQGKQKFDPNICHRISLEGLVPKDHFLRKVANAVDLSFIGDLARPFYCHGNGRPSIDPEIYFRMTLLGYLYGISSDRRLCEEIQVNVAYRWFCHLTLTEQVPEHSSLTRIRNRLGENGFKQIFDKILDQCVAKGLVEGKSIISDGSLFEANASNTSMVKKEQSIPENPKNDKFASESDDGGAKTTNKTHVSKTDLEATFVNRAGKAKHLSYKDSATRPIHRLMGPSV